MNILLTGANSIFISGLAEELTNKHTIRMSDSIEVDTDTDFVLSDLNHCDSTNQLVDNIDVIIHPTYSPRTDDQETDWVDVNCRCQYNLLLAASNAHVRHVILLSTLDLFLPYKEDLTVSEDWKPLPSTDPRILGAHLAEFSAREFSHCNALDVTVLRLGHLARTSDVVNKTFDPIWLDERDAYQAISLLIDKFQHSPEKSNYRALHLQSTSTKSRFSVSKISSFLDFVPKYQFEAQ